MIAQSLCYRRADDDGRGRPSGRLPEDTGSRREAAECRPCRLLAWECAALRIVARRCDPKIRACGTLHVVRFGNRTMRSPADILGMWKAGEGPPLAGAGVLCRLAMLTGLSNRACMRSSATEDLQVRPCRHQPPPCVGDRSDVGPTARTRHSRRRPSRLHPSVPGHVPVNIGKCWDTNARHFKLVAGGRPLHASAVVLDALATK